MKNRVSKIIRELIEKGCLAHIKKPSCKKYKTAAYLKRNKDQNW